MFKSIFDSPIFPFCTAIVFYFSGGVYGSEPVPCPSLALIGPEARQAILEKISPNEIRLAGQLAQRYEFLRNLRKNGHKTDPDDPATDFESEEKLLEPLARAFAEYQRDVRVRETQNLHYHFSDKSALNKHLQNRQNRTFEPLLIRENKALLRDRRLGKEMRQSAANLKKQLSLYEIAISRK